MPGALEGVGCHPGELRPEADERSVDGPSLPDEAWKPEERWWNVHGLRWESGLATSTLWMGSRGCLASSRKMGSKEKTWLRELGELHFGLPQALHRMQRPGPHRVAMPVGQRAWMGRTAPSLSCPSPVAERTQREEILLHGGLTCFSLPELLGDRQHEGSPTCQPVGGPVAWARLVPSSDSPERH